MTGAYALAGVLNFVNSPAFSAGYNFGYGFGQGYNAFNQTCCRGMHQYANYGFNNSYNPGGYSYNNGGLSGFSSYNPFYISSGVDYQINSPFPYQGDRGLAFSPLSTWGGNYQSYSYLNRTNPFFNASYSGGMGSFFGGFGGFGF